MTDTIASSPRILLAVGGALVALSAALGLAWFTLGATSGAAAGGGVVITRVLLATALAVLLSGGALALLAMRLLSSDRAAPQTAAGRESRSGTTQPSPQASPTPAMAKPVPTRAPESGANLEIALQAGQLAGLRTQVDELCRLLGAGGAAAGLPSALSKSGIGPIAVRAMTYAQATACTVASPGLARELEAEGIVMAPEVLVALQVDLAGMSQSLAGLAARCGNDPAQLSTRGLAAELHRTLSAGMDSVQRLLMESTLLLTAVADLASTLVEHCRRLRQLAGERAERLTQSSNEPLGRRRAASHGWPDARGNDTLADLESGDDAAAIPARKLN